MYKLHVEASMTYQQAHEDQSNDFVQDGLDESRPLAKKMSGLVTVHAKRNEIFFGIISQPAARTDVVDLKIARRTAILAAPPIAREYLVRELAIRLGFKP